MVYGAADHGWLVYPARSCRALGRSLLLGSPANPRVNEELGELLHEASLFDEDRV
jgi:hypothetical protein